MGGFTRSRRKFIHASALAAGGAIVGTPHAEGSAGSAQPPQASGSPGQRFRAILNRNEPVMCPAVHDVLTARMCESEGFEWLTVGGSAVSASGHGIPDVGLVTITELIDYAGNIAQHVNIPVLADADDGGGSPINVYRAVQIFEKRGVAAVMLEDTVQVKHLQRTGNELVTKAQFVDKIKAAVDARKDGLVIVSRTDALAEGLSMEQAMERGVATAEAGADVIFFSGIRLEDCAKARAQVKKPLMTTVGSSTPFASLKPAGISLAVYAGQLLQIGLGASLQALRELKSTGVMVNAAKLTIAGDVYQKLIGSQETIARGRKYNLVR